MGIDFGSKKVGVALSDEAQSLAFPNSVLTNDGRLLGEIAKRIKDAGVEVVVMGESRNYQGEDNTIMHSARAFADQLSAKTGCAIHFEPEMLTTKEAERLQGPSLLTDAAAAALILQSYIDKQPTQHGIS